jgi:4-cresol dehydrogenase (hydroxylating)
MRAPPGIASADFGAALQEFAAVVGKEWVFTTDEDLDLYRDSYSPLRGMPEERIGSAAIAPNSAEEVQAVVRIANRFGVPLYPISTGKNLGYGGAAPVYSGSVVLDLKRMNRIIEVDDVNHYAIVEPGVSYFDLFDYIQEKKLKVWIDCPDPGWGSLIGNALDHGVGYTMPRFRNHFDAHCGLEVVLANGEMLRTGMGAMPNATTWAQFKLGFGPVIDGIFSQSNFGVVTKMGFWLMPEPEALLQASILAPRYDDLRALVNLLNYAENSGLTTGLPQLTSPLLGLGDVQEMVSSFFSGPPKITSTHRQLIDTAKVGYSTALEKYGADNQIPYWGVQLSFYGPPKVVAAQWEAVRDLATKAIRAARFKTGPIMTLPLTKAQTPAVHLQQVGIPNLEFFAYGARSSSNPHPTSGHMWFSPVIPRTAEAIFEANRVFADATEALKIPVIGLKPFALPTGLFERTFLILLGFPITEDPELNKTFVRGFGELVRIGAEHGWGEYRTPTIFQDQVMGVYSYNDNILRRFHETLKDAVDPKGILSAGRYGIWPRHLRSTS